MDTVTLLHLAREHSAAVAFRPISFGNLSYLADRVTDLRAIGSDLARHATHDAPMRDHLRTVSNQLLTLDEHSDRARFVEIVIACDRTGYRTALQSKFTHIPASSSPLTKRPYHRIILIAGPALGLGDEICAAELIADLVRRFAASLEVYSSYSAFWRTCFPEARVGSLTGRPMRALERIQSEVLTGDCRDLLLIFLNFSGLDFHLLLGGRTPRPDIAEFAVGKGKMWFAPGDSSTVSVVEDFDPVWPSNYRSLRSLGRRLTGAAPVPNWACARPRIRVGGQLRVVVNPLTSKDMILSPGDWVALIERAIHYRASRAPIHLQIHTGLTPESETYSQQLLNMLELRRLDGVTMEPLGSGDHGSTGPGNVLRSICERIGKADAVLGVDTFTAHLAGLFAIPSLAICYDRNVSFWSDCPYTWWIEIKHGFDDVSRCIALMLDFNAGEKASRAWALECGALWNGILARNGSSGSVADNGLVAAADRAWRACPAHSRRLLCALDEGYAWPRLADLLRNPFLPDPARDWLMYILPETHFYRFCATACRGAGED